MSEEQVREIKDKFCANCGDVVVTEWKVAKMQMNM